MTYDVILVAVFAAAFAVGYIRGMLKTIWGVVALVCSVALTAAGERYVSGITELNPIIVTAVLFVIIRIALWLVYRAADMALKLPVLKQINGLLGGVFVLAVTAAAAYAVFGLMQMNGDFFETGTLCAYMEEHNLLTFIIGL